MIALIIATILVLANHMHVLTQWLANKPGFAFGGIAHYYQDYFLYASYIAQGVQGSWVGAHHMFTDEPLGTFWYYWIYVLMGKIGGLLGANALTIYNISLLLFIILLLKALHTLAKHIFTVPVWTTIGFLLITTASNFINIGEYLSTGTLSLVGMNWFSPTPALNRLGGVPHQTLQTLLLVVLLLLVGKGQTYSTKAKIIIAITSLIVALINPVQSVLFVAALCAAIATLTLITKKYTPKLLISSLIPTLLIVGVPTMLGVYLSNLAVSSQEIFSLARSWELNQKISISMWEFIISLGPIILCIPFGVVAYFKKLSIIKLTLFYIGIASMIVFVSPIPALVHVAAVRWLSPFAYLLFPVIATFGLIEIVRKVRAPRALSLTMALFVYLLLTIPALGTQIQARTNTQTNQFLISNLNHIPQSWIEALLFLQKQSESGVVLVHPELDMSFLIPAFSYKPVYSGHMLHTLDIAKKEQLRRNFFSGVMKPTEQQAFLRAHRIDFIIASDSSPILSNLVQPIYTHASIRIDKVIH